jgi:hypothetical protein
MDQPIVIALIVGIVLGAVPTGMFVAAYYRRRIRNITVAAQPIAAPVAAQSEQTLLLPGVAAGRERVKQGARGCSAGHGATCSAGQRMAGVCVNDNCERWVIRD